MIETPQHKAIADKVTQIRGLLGLGPARQQLPGDLLRALERRLRAAQSGTVADLHPALCQLRRRIHIEHKRHYFFCLMLLEKLYLVPPDGPAEAAVAQMLQDCYLECDRNGQRYFKEELQSAALALCRSSHTLTRRLASELRVLVPVSPVEAAWLGKRSGFPDVQFRIAERILNNPAANAAFLPHWLRFLVQMIQANGGHAERARLMLAEVYRFGLEVAIVLVFEEYSKHYGDSECRGAFLEALAAFRAPLVPQLESLYRGKPRDRQVVLHLLRHMAKGGAPVPEASRMLWKIARSVSAAEFERDVRWALEQAIEGLQDAPESKSKTIQWDIFREEAGAALAAPQSACKDLAQKVLQRSPHSAEAISLEFARRCCQPIPPASMEDHKRLRKYQGWSFVAQLLRDPTEGDEVRIGAARLLPRLQGKRDTRRPVQIAELLWRIYTRETKTRLRIAALEALAQVTAPRESDYRSRLGKDLESAEPELWEAINRAWPAFFPDATLPALRDTSAR